MRNIRYLLGKIPGIRCLDLLSGSIKVHNSACFSVAIHLRISLEASSFYCFGKLLPTQFLNRETVCGSLKLLPDYKDASAN